MKHTRTLLVNLFCALFCSAWAVDNSLPENYYASAEGKCGEELRQALFNIIKTHTTISYDNLDYLYPASDITADGKVWDMYSTCTWTHGNKKCGNYSIVCDCYNKEHSVPQSWFSKASPMVSDAFHVYPTDGKVNGQRGNYEFGECSEGKSLGGAALGRLGTSTFEGYTNKGTVFEPDDQYKGDFARSYFYMATCYADKCSSWGNTFGNNNGLSDYGVALMLNWHAKDPVSDKELVRNEVIYGNTKYNNTSYKQGNRNPFIDYPELADYIWGDKKTTPVSFSTLKFRYTDETAGTTGNNSEIGNEGTGDTNEGGNDTENEGNNTEIVIPAKPVILFGTKIPNTNGTITISGTTTTLNLHISNLATNVTVTSSDTNIFETNVSTVTPDQAANGVTITLTKKGSGRATLTITGGVVSQTYTVVCQ